MGKPRENVSGRAEKDRGREGIAFRSANLYYFTHIKIKM
jgi:hypothetical protein